MCGSAESEDVESACDESEEEHSSTSSEDDE
jgi:hypothetical protein